jgi:hypothetical protein
VALTIRIERWVLVASSIGWPLSALHWPDGFSEPLGKMQ